MPVFHSLSIDNIVTTVSLSVNPNDKNIIWTLLLTNKNNDKSVFGNGCITTDTISGTKDDKDESETTYQDDSYKKHSQFILMLMDLLEIANERQANAMCITVLYNYCMNDAFEFIQECDSIRNTLISKAYVLKDESSDLPYMCEAVDKLLIALNPDIPHLKQ